MMGTDVWAGELHQTAPGGMVPLREKLPPLEHGDRLTRSDFERRYEAMPHVKKAELIVSALVNGALAHVLAE